MITAILIFGGLGFLILTPFVRGFVVGLGLLPDHVVHITDQDGHYSTNFDDDLSTNNFSVDIRHDSLEDDITHDWSGFDTLQFSNHVEHGAGFYGSSAEAASHGALFNVSGGDDGPGFYV